MYAQLVQGSTTPDQRAEMDRIVSDDLIPALRDEPGFVGTLNLVDRSTGDALMIVLWDSIEHARRPIRQYGRRFVEAVENVAAISTGIRQQTSLWEVNARV
jgi:hypothetical protein